MVRENDAMSIVCSIRTDAPAGTLARAAVARTTTNIAARDAVRLRITDDDNSHQLAERTEIEIEIFRRQSEFRADVADGLFETHECEADGFNFFTRERLLLHAPNGLPLHQLAQKFH